ncbi:MAG: hypothetical protein ACP5O7_13120 [Phycisphaerae bacterium]
MNKWLYTISSAVLLGTVLTAVAAPYAVPKAVGKWAREKGYYKTVRLHHMGFIKFELTHLLDGTTVVMAGRGYIERPPGSHLWTEYLPPIHSARLWLFSCAGGSRRHLFFRALTWPKWNTGWLCSVRPARMLIPYTQNGVAAFASGHVGAFTLGKHLILTEDGGRHWLPQPKLGAGRLYRLKWLSKDRLLIAGVKATLLLQVHSDGHFTLLARGAAIPLNTPKSQCVLVRFGWPITWWGIYPNIGNKGPALLEKADLQTKNVLEKYPVQRAKAFFPFDGGFIAVARHKGNLGSIQSWLEVYRVRNHKAVLVHKTDSNLWQKLEWRSHGRLVYNGSGKSRLYQLDIATGKVKPTSIQYKEWIVPPNPNSSEVIMQGKAWHRAVAALLRGTSKLKGPYKKKFFHDFLKRGRPGADPWKWMKVNMDEISKLYAEQQAAAGK